METETTTTETIASPILALATFLAGTMVEGCLCETCAERKSLITSLVYARASVSESALLKAVEGVL
mgnify:FL=1|jgi:hypothetical protein